MKLIEASCCSAEILQMFPIHHLLSLMHAMYCPGWRFTTCISAAFSPLDWSTSAVKEDAESFDTLTTWIRFSSVGIK
jgi:hypothetical protein